jgi:hypothetical protein
MLLVLLLKTVSQSSFNALHNGFERQCCSEYRCDERNVRFTVLSMQA